MSEKLANLLSASDDAGALSGAREADAASVLPLAWERIRTGLRRDLGAKLFDQWLRAAQLGEYCDFSRTLEIWLPSDFSANFVAANFQDRLRLARSEEHTSELQSLMRISYAVFCLKTKKFKQKRQYTSYNVT